MKARALWPLIVVVTWATGCIENYKGTRIEANISVLSGEDYSLQDLVLPTPGLNPGEPGYFSHYELHAEISGWGTVRLKSFIIQPSVHTLHPCSQYVPDTYCRPTDEYPCASPYINTLRFASLETIMAAVSVAETVEAGGAWIHDPGYNFMDPDRFPDRLFLDPDLTTPASKLARENLDEEEVRDFCDDLPEGYYLGNFNQLTLPEKGEHYGAIDGPDPRTGSRIGGITFFVAAKLEKMSALILTRERDPSRLSEERIDENLPPGEDGQIFLIAQKQGPWGYITFDEYRGVMTVQMESPLGVPVVWRSTVYYNMDEDPINF